MLGILATEASAKLDVMGQLRGYAIVVFSVGLFCGSIHMVLATDLGNKMSFLVSFASLTGFLAMLGLIWFTNLTPLNALHGPPAHWVVQEIVADPAQAKTEEVRAIAREGEVLEPAEQGEVKATVDAAVTAEGSEFKQFNKPADYVVVNAERIGGGSLSFFRHRPLFSVMAIQGAREVEPLPGAAPPPPSADPSKPVKYIVMERDLGAMRQPPIVMAAAMSILFALSLYGMHNLERAEQRAKAAELEPAPTPVPA